MTAGGKAMTALGVMSGTSLDGVDVAIVETDGLTVKAFGPRLHRPYERAVRRQLMEACETAQKMSPRDAVPDSIRNAESAMTRIHLKAIADLMNEKETPAIDLIGYHGQTLVHRPEKKWSWQIGDARSIARATGTDIVYDFRAADVAAGGQGAPLAPLYHAALLASSPDSISRPSDWPVAVLNIGGVANVTWIRDSRTIESLDGIIAFDTGPGNCLTDLWMMKHTGSRMDEDGKTAAAGHIDRSKLQSYLAHPYIGQTVPKSLDRGDFDTGIVDGMGLADGAATLTAVTAACVDKAQEHFPEPVRCWYVCGGGASNPTLMRALRQSLQAPVQSVSELGWHADDLEAEAFAFLAVRSWYEKPLTLPQTTGVPAPQNGGRKIIAKAEEN